MPAARRSTPSVARLGIALLVVALGLAAVAVAVHAAIRHPRPGAPNASPPTANADAGKPSDAPHEDKPLKEQLKQGFTDFGHSVRDAAKDVGTQVKKTVSGDGTTSDGAK
jgi:hypothetical protein